MNRIHAALICVLAAGCSDDTKILPTSPSTTTNVNTNNNTTTITITFPTPGLPTTGGGVPGEPPSATPLPLPSYVTSVVTQVHNSNPALLANSCVSQFGPSGWAFLDAVVDALRIRDQRFGYVCTGSDCANPVQDSISYRATADPVVGIHIVDLIDAYCSTPTLNVRDLGYFPNGRYSTRNRF